MGKEVCLVRLAWVGIPTPPCWHPQIQGAAEVQGQVSMTRKGIQSVRPCQSRDSYGVTQAWVKGYIDKRGQIIRVLHGMSHVP